MAASSGSRHARATAISLDSETNFMGTSHHNAWYRASLLLAVVWTCSCAHTVESPAHPHHGIDYVEFVVTDMAESKRFYTAAFDWEFNDYGPDYAGIRGRGGEVGGLRLDTNASTGGPLVILYSKDLETTVERVRGAGGRIVKEPFSFPGGRRFHFHDPSGNELAVWSEP
jgi:predicted enzyme related to lactoylglutathione lyase